MIIFENILIILIAIECFYIQWIEMVSWSTKGASIFPEPEPGFFDKTKSMAANQGLYNGFLGAGLICSAIISDPIWKLRASAFFLICIIIAGIFGAISVTKSIFIKQSIPSLIVLLALFVIYYLA